MRCNWTHKVGYEAERYSLVCQLVKQHACHAGKNGHLVARSVRGGGQAPRCEAALPNLVGPGDDVGDPHQASRSTKPRPLGWRFEGHALSVKALPGMKIAR